MYICARTGPARAYTASVCTSVGSAGWPGWGSNPGCSGAEREEADVPRRQGAALSRSGPASNLGRRGLCLRRRNNNPKSTVRVGVGRKRLLSLFLNSGGGFTGVYCLNSFFFFFLALIFKSYLCLVDYILNLFGSIFFFLVKICL